MHYLCQKDKWALSGNLQTGDTVAFSQFLCPLSLLSLSWDKCGAYSEIQTPRILEEEAHFQNTHFFFS
jgi:hypothetical protein